MSFQEQERALFDLLFEKPLREAFCWEGPDALADYALTDEEKARFNTVRPDALQMDAAMRTRLMLAAFCRSFPLSFSIFSSLEDGFARLEEPLNSALMQNPPAHRPALYGRHLSVLLKTDDFLDEKICRAAMAVIEAEASVAFAAALLKDALLQGETAEPDEVPQDWQDKPLKLADYVVSAVLPSPYQTLLTGLCPTVGAGLWQHLKTNPLPAALRDTILAVEEPRFMLVKAGVRQQSICDPVTDHKTVELSAGFEPIFRHINGQTSANRLLQLLQKAGAKEGLLQSVHRQLLQLLQEGMLVTGTSNR